MKSFELKTGIFRNYDYRKKELTDFGFISLNQDSFFDFDKISCSIKNEAIIPVFTIEGAEWYLLSSNQIINIENFKNFFEIIIKN